LDPLDEISQFLASFFQDRSALCLLRQERNNSHARVASDNCDVDVLGVFAREAGDEGGCADNIEGGDTKQLLRVVCAGLLEYLGCDGDRRVYRV